MSVAKLKEEAIRTFVIKVESTEDERTLKIILDFLNSIDSNDKNGVNLSRHYDHIKAKYGSVLKRLK